MDKKLGFGCMRLPMVNGEVAKEEFIKMIDYFMAHGFNYFDTAHGYIEGKSEEAIRECLTKRYKREEYILTNKLTGKYFTKEEDIRPFFEQQLAICGVTYFDYYLMHAQNRDVYEKFKECHAYEVASSLKKEGKIKHLGLSFHDKAFVLEKILSEQKDVEVVQIQLNYLDYDDEIVESRKCLEVCQKYHKPVIVMEPVKGGALVNIEEEAKKIFQDLNGKMSCASYAIRFAASEKGVFKVLSGMSNLEQMIDNVSYMEDFKPLEKEEYDSIKKVVNILKKKDLIPCTACRYCTEGCPMKILIPDLFNCYNRKLQFNDFDIDRYNKITSKSGKASSCIKCGQCEKICPQKIKIREMLEKVADTFE